MKILYLGSGLVEARGIEVRPYYKRLEDPYYKRLEVFIRVLEQCFFLCYPPIIEPNEDISLFQLTHQSWKLYLVDTLFPRLKKLRVFQFLEPCWCPHTKTIFPFLKNPNGPFFSGFQLLIQPQILFTQLVVGFPFKFPKRLVALSTFSLNIIYI